MTHDEMIAVIQAHKDRKALQFRACAFGNEWMDICTDPSWDFNKYEYRVKPNPEPREWFAELLPNNIGIMFTGGPNQLSVGGTFIKVREVLE